MSDTFTCDLCGETYDKSLTDEEAAAQLGEEFPGAEQEECGVVCDDCFKRMFPNGPPGEMQQ